MRNYDEDSDTGYIFKADVEYPQRLHNLHNLLPFLPKRIRIKSCCKVVCNLYDKE